MADKLFNKPTVLEWGHRGIRFVIMDMPSDSQVPVYAEILSHYHTKCLVRACEATYDTKPIEDRGIPVYDLPFHEEGTPSKQTILCWLSLLHKFASVLYPNPHTQHHATFVSKFIPHLSRQHSQSQQQQSQQQSQSQSQQTHNNQQLHSGFSHHHPHQNQPAIVQVASLPHEMNNKNHNHHHHHSYRHTTTFSRSKRQEVSKTSQKNDGIVVGGGGGGNSSSTKDQSSSRYEGGGEEKYDEENDDEKMSHSSNYGKQQQQQHQISMSSHHHHHMGINNDFHAKGYRHQSYYHHDHHAHDHAHNNHAIGEIYTLNKPSIEAIQEDEQMTNMKQPQITHSHDNVSKIRRKSITNSRSWAAAAAAAATDEAPHWHQQHHYHDQEENRSKTRRKSLCSSVQKVDEASVSSGEEIRLRQDSKSVSSSGKDHNSNLCHCTLSTSPTSANSSQSTQSDIKKEIKTGNQKHDHGAQEEPHHHTHPTHHQHHCCASAVLTHDPKLFRQRHFLPSGSVLWGNAGMVDNTSQHSKTRQQDELLMSSGKTALQQVKLHPEVNGTSRFLSGSLSGGSQYDLSSQYLNQYHRHHHHVQHHKMTIAVHCIAGLGRSPLLVAIALIEIGCPNEKAIAFIRKKRSARVFSPHQVEYIKRYRPILLQTHDLQEDAGSSGISPSGCCGVM